MAHLRGGTVIGEFYPAPVEPASDHSELAGKLLIFHGGKFASFSEWALISQENHSDFDSAIPRFESWRPSHAVLSLGGVSRSRQFTPYYRGLARRYEVSAAQFCGFYASIV
jgi:hypothetical protein